MFINRKCFLITLLLLSTVTCQHQFIKCELPNGCKLKLIEDLSFFQYRNFFCDHIDAKFEMGFKQSQLDQQCVIPKGIGIQLLRIHMRANSRIILDESFDFEGLVRVYAESNDALNSKFSLELIFSELKGFDISSFKSRLQFFDTQLEVFIFDSSFEFYSKNKRIDSCDDYLNAIESSQTKDQNIFQACSFPCWVKLKQVDFSTPICPLAFNNSNIKNLLINSLMKTFYRTNLISFSDTNLSVECCIEEVLFVEVNKISLDKRLVRPDVFKNMEFFSLYGLVESIQVDIFLPENFPRLKTVQLGFQFFTPLIHKQGINWIESLNKGLNYNMTNKNFTWIDMIMKMIKVKLVQDAYTTTLGIFQSTNRNDYFPDEDFCLYWHFPFHQLVFILINDELTEDKPLENFTCTLTWLLQYVEEVASMNYNIKNIRDTFAKCKFTEFIVKCNKTNFKMEKFHYNIFSIIDSMIIFEFISIILVPLICLFGFIGNILVIVVISRQKLKENQYIYMRLKALFNCLILFVKMPSMINECQSNGLLCSTVRKFIGIQYIKIIFSEFFSNYFRFVSNMLHIAFLFNRLSLVGKDHGKFTEFMSKLRPRNFLIFSLIIGVFVNFAKGFRLRSNFNDYDRDYPFNYLDSYSKRLYDGYELQRAIAILNCLCDLINGIVFFLVCLVIDIRLLIALKRTIAEKITKLEMIKSGLNTESKKAALKNAVFRANIMVILNSISNLLLKTPITIIAVFELVRFFKGFSTRYYTDDLFPSAVLHQLTIFYLFMKLELLKIRSTLEHFGECLFLISMGFDILFYYNFDTVFKEAFLIVFLHQAKAKNTN